MTLNELAYNLLNLLRGGRSNHDEHISIPQIKFNIQHYRAMFIRRDHARNGFTSRHVEQNLGCLELEKVDANNCIQHVKKGMTTHCYDPSLKTGCSVYRTKLTIPKTVRYNFEEAITYVGDVSGTGKIPFINANMIPFLGFDKYTSDMMKAYMLGDRMFIWGAQGLKYINVRGVFQNPQEISEFTDCTEGAVCYDDDITDYPIPWDMVNLINQGLVGGELALLTGTFSDILTDRTQDLRTVGGTPKSSQQQTEQ